MSSLDVTRNKLSEQKLAQVMMRYQDVFEGFGIGIAFLDYYGSFVKANNFYLDMLGIEQKILSNLTIADVTHPVDWENMQSSYFRLQNGLTDFDIMEQRFIRKDKSRCWARVTARPIYNELGEVALLMMAVVDISHYKVYTERSKLMHKVFEETAEAIVITDMQQKIVDVNNAYCALTGYSREELLGKARTVNSQHHDVLYYQHIQDALDSTGHWQGELWKCRKNGEVFPAWENVTAVKDEAQRVVNYISAFSEISAIKLAEEKLSHLAHHDSLTRLPNRLLFSANLEQVLQHAKRRHKKAALLFLDLDQFKYVNDTLGHAAGDQLLMTIADRLKKCVRAEDTVARIGGDEFTIVLAEISHPEDAAILAQKVVELVADPIVLDGREVVVQTSVGISVFPNDADSAEDLMKSADIAMYHAKELGRNNYQFFTEKLNARALKQLTLEQELRRAIEREEFELFYQPQIALDTGKIMGVEALIRWRHPQKGLILPSEFIPVAEETTLIEKIGEWVLHTACLQALSWRSAGLPILRIGVNVAGRQIESAGALRKLRLLVERNVLRPCALQIDFEITEKVLQVADESKDEIERLRDLGVKFFIDDFGTGFSSLSRLKFLPIDALKIDRSFIQDITHAKDDQAIAKAIVAMGHSLNLKVIGEGVETKEQQEFLRTIGCDEIQGFFVSEPMPVEAITQTLADAEV